jgi:hypothetical protein
MIPGERMPAPPELSPEQAAIWGKIIAALPQGWVTNGSAHLLKELCRHVDSCDRLSADIERARSEITTLATEPAEGADARRVEVRRRKGQAHLLSLMRMHRSLSATVASLSGKLRLTKLSQYMRDAEGAAIAARNAPTGKPPWLDW